MRGIRRALLFSASLALLPSVSSADDPYADYRIPEHYWRSWTASLQGEGNRSVAQANFGSPFTEGTLQGTGSTSLFGGYDSDPRSSFYNLSLAATGFGRHRSSHNEFAPPPTTQDRVDGQQRAAQRLLGSYGLSRHPWTTPLGYSLGVNAIGQLEQFWFSSSEVDASPGVESHSTSNGTVGMADGRVALTASVSWGRVRDATPVYQVQVLEQRLLELGAIERALSPSARERLAALYTVESALAFAHQRPTKYFWRELERLLTDDGVLGPGGLNAYAVQRLLEPIAVSPSGVVARARGFSVGPKVLLAKDWSHRSGESAVGNAVILADTVFSSSESIAPRTEFDEHDESIFSGAFVEYHRPFGMRWQVDGISQGLLSESGEDLNAITSLSTSWQVADRWFVVGGFLHGLSAPGHGLERRVQQWDVTGNVSVNYFFEDAWAFQLGLVDRQSHDTDSYFRQDTFQFGITYQFAGWLNAPGLFEPMRLSPPAR